MKQDDDEDKFCYLFRTWTDSSEEDEEFEIGEEEQEQLLAEVLRENRQLEVVCPLFKERPFFIEILWLIFIGAKHAAAESN